MERRVAAEPLISLRECARQLSGDQYLGDRAPARLTLQRWAEAGVLDAASGMKSGAKFPSYRLSAVLRIVTARRTTAGAARGAVTGGALNISGAEPQGAGNLLGYARQPMPAGGLRPTSVPPMTRPAATDAGEQPILAILNEIAGTLMEIKASLASRSDQERAIANGLDNLDAIRKTMMAKYDAEATSLRSRVVELDRERTELRKGSSVIDVTRLNSFMGRITEQLQALSGSMAPQTPQAAKPPHHPVTSQSL